MIKSDFHNGFIVAKHVINDGEITTYEDYTFYNGVISSYN
jgi:hypothetical protein